MHTIVTYSTGRVKAASAAEASVPCHRWLVDQGGHGMDRAVLERALAANTAAASAQSSQPAAASMQSGQPAAAVSASAPEPVPAVANAWAAKQRSATSLFKGQPNGSLVRRQEPHWEQQHRGPAEPSW